MKHLELDVWLLVIQAAEVERGSCSRYEAI